MAIKQEWVGSPLCTISYIVEGWGTDARLNAFKLEMPVHPASKTNTHYFIWWVSLLLFDCAFTVVFACYLSEIWLIHRFRCRRIKYQRYEHDPATNLNPRPVMPFLLLPFTPSLCFCHAYAYSVDTTSHFTHNITLNSYLATCFVYALYLLVILS